jgi:hypothetical protein
LATPQNYDSSCKSFVLNLVCSDVEKSILLLGMSIDFTDFDFQDGTGGKSHRKHFTFLKNKKEGEIKCFYF